MDNLNSDFDLGPLLQLAKNVGVSDIKGLQAATTQRVSALQYCQISQAIFEHTSDETIGLFTAGPLPIGAFKHMCYSGLSCVSVRHLIRRMAEFYEVCDGPVLKPHLDEQKESGWLSITTTKRCPDTLQGALASRRGMAVMSLRVWINMLSWWTSTVIRPIAYSLPNPQEGVFGEYVRCDSARRTPGLLLSRATLDMPLVRDIDELQRFLSLAPASLLENEVLNQSWGQKVMHQLRASAPQIVPMAVVAQSLGVSVASLRRLLISENNSFRQIKDNMLRDWCLMMIQKPGLSLTEISETLGFSSVSNFHRKFKTWTGTTPRTFRKSLSEGTTN